MRMNDLERVAETEHVHFAVPNEVNANDITLAVPFSCFAGLGRGLSGCMTSVATQMGKASISNYEMTWVKMRARMLSFTRLIPLPRLAASNPFRHPQRTSAVAQYERNFPTLGQKSSKYSRARIQIRAVMYGGSDEGCESRSPRSRETGSHDVTSSNCCGRGTREQFGLRGSTGSSTKDTWKS